jgi:RNA polymerase sigma-70 factor (ECF subfamily)
MPGAADSVPESRIADSPQRRTLALTVALAALRWGTGAVGLYVRRIFVGNPSEPTGGGTESRASQGVFASAAKGYPEEATWVEKAKAGDQDALCALLGAFGPMVRDRLKGKISQQWRSSLDEDDVMQVTYLEAFLLIEQFTPRGPGSFMAWLSQVAENNLRDALRGLQAVKRPNPKRRVQVSGTASRDSFVALVDLLGTDHGTPSRVAAIDEATQFVEAALGQLPPDYERVVRLYDLEGQSAADVAAQLGRSPGAIYMLRARALERLKNSLGSESRFFSKQG